MDRRARTPSIKRRFTRCLFFPDASHRAQTRIPGSSSNGREGKAPAGPQTGDRHSRAPSDNSPQIPTATSCAGSQTCTPKFNGPARWRSNVPTRLGPSPA